MIAIENDYLKLVVNPLGAEWHSIILKNENRECLWQGLSDFWPRRAPLLFPTVGELNDNAFRWNGKSYSLKRHGFIRFEKFELIHQSANELEWEVCATAETLKVFPFHFSFRVLYTLLDNEIKTRILIFNPDSQSMFYSVGAHPAFLLPGGMNNYFLEFEREEKTKRLFVREGLISDERHDFEPVLRKLPLDTTLFDSDALVFRNLNSRSITIKRNNDRPVVKMVWDEIFSHFGIWSAKNCLHFVCLEPWAGLADHHGFSGDFTQKEGIRSLGAGCDDKFVFSCFFY